MGSGGLIALAAVLIISQQHSRSVCNRARQYWVTQKSSRVFSELLVGVVKTSKFEGKPFRRSGPGGAQHLSHLP